MEVLNCGIYLHLSKEFSFAKNWLALSEALGILCSHKTSLMLSWFQTGLNQGKRTSLELFSRLGCLNWDFFRRQRTVEEITTVTTETIVVEDAAPEEDLTPLQTVKKNLGRRSRRREIQAISGNETITRKDHAAGASMADHPHGQGGAADHPLGMSQETSLRRGGVKSRGKSRQVIRMERRGDDPAEGAAQGA